MAHEISDNSVILDDTIPASQISQVRRNISRNSSNLSSDSTRNRLYSITLNVLLREFCRQNSGSTIDPVVVCGDSLDEWKSHLWTLVKHLLKRKVVFVNNVPTWHENVHPLETELPDFIAFKAEKAHKTLLKLDQVTRTILHHWRQQSVQLIVYVYSSNVAQKSDFLQVKEILLKPEQQDRSKAQAHEEIVNLMVKLQREQKGKYKAAEINWFQWANYIASEPAHLRETLIKEDPPTHLLLNFELINNSEEILNNVRRDSSIALGMNDDYKQQIDKISELFKKYQDIRKDRLKLEQLEDLVLNDLVGRMNVLGIQTSANGNILEGLSRSLSVAESEHSIGVFDRITEQLDIDH